MSDVTHILSQIESGDPTAAEQLLPLVYDELRRLAEQKLTHEEPGQTLQATALVHEAYLRLVGSGQEQRWNNRRHFSPPLPRVCDGFLSTMPGDERALAQAEWKIAGLGGAAELLGVNIAERDTGHWSAWPKDHPANRTGWQ